MTENKEVKDMNKLKPCPFCGAIPQSGVDFYGSRGTEIKLAAIVECTGCGICKRVIFKATNDVIHIPFSDYEEAFNKVTKEWNTRIIDKELEKNNDIM